MHQRNYITGRGKRNKTYNGNDIFCTPHTESRRTKTYNGQQQRQHLLAFADQGGETGSEVSGADPQSHYFKHPKYKVINLRVPAAGQQVTNCWESDL